MSYPTETADDRAAAGAVLGLSPLLVLATNFVDAIALAAGACAALIGVVAIATLIGGRMSEVTRLSATMLAVGLCASAVMLLFQAFAFDTYQRIALLVPIAIANWLVLARLDPGTAAGPTASANVAALLYAAAALVLVGAVSEIVGNGIRDVGFPFAALPSGAFVTAGLLLAVRNAFGRRV
jgi:Na+-translocating ferredoxin:NAD+ oxidoreductase RnfE subunit